MIHRLQRKFILIIMTIVSILLTLILCSISVFLYFNLKSQTNTSLKNAVSFVESWEETKQAPAKDATDTTNSVGKQEADKPEVSTATERLVKPSDLKKQEYAMAYSSISVVSYDTKTQKLDVKLKNSTINESLLKVAAKKVSLKKTQQGTVLGNQFYYYSTEYENGLFIAFAKTDTVTTTLTRYLILIGCTELIALVLIFFTSIYLAKIATEPIEKVMLEQKRFIADASHELKTPLTVIMANNSILAAHPSEQIHKHMNWIQSTDEEIKHMSRLINDMLILAKSESGMIEKDFVMVDLSEMVMRTVLQFEGIAYEKSITIEDKIEEHIFILGNEMLLKQLVMVFLDNAVKYESNQGEIVVTLSKKKEKIKFSVLNKKSYLEEEVLLHVFDRFYRADESQKSSESYGLGLSIAQSIVKRHNGQIYASSKKDEGTLFWAIFG